MTQDNKQANNQVTGQTAGEGKAGAVNEPAITGSLKDELEQETRPAKLNQQAEELPEEIKKKLEQGQADKTRPKQRKRKKKTEKHVRAGKAYIKATYNNTMITLTDLNGNVLSWASAGLAGFKGPKKATPYAAQIITRMAVQKTRAMGLNEVSVFVQGVGTGRESAVRALNANGLNITSIKDVTPIPHNGCRRKKPRRV